MAFGVIKNVRKVFQLEEIGWSALEPIVALDDASFRFEEGELVALLGPSGCGKTTLLRIIGGLIAKTAGSVAIDGREVTKPMGDYGFVFQTPSLMGLSGFLSARPHQLSGGMQQRVALCRALVHQPRLLLMDEPFGALDELTRMDMNDLLLRIRHETKASVLFVTHSISEAVYLSDKVVVFSKRPARVVKEITIPLSYPRSQKVRFTTAFTTAERIASEALGVVAPAAEEASAQ